MPSKFIISTKKFESKKVSTSSKIFCSCGQKLSFYNTMSAVRRVIIEE